MTAGSGNQPREHWLDSARGFAMLCVMLGHAVERMTTALSLPMAGWLWNLRTFVYSFHVPLFFAVAGWLYAARGAEETPGCYIRKRTLGLLVPYLFFSLVVWAGKVLFPDYVNVQTTPDDLLSVFTAPFTYLWFIYVLYLISVAVRLLENAVKRRPPLLICALAAGVLSCVFPTPVDALNKVLLYLPVYLLGAVLHDADDRFRRTAGAVCAVLFVASLPFYWKAPAYSAWWLVAGFTSAAALLWVFRSFEKGRCRPLRVPGRSTLYIYILHPVIMNAVRMMLMRLHVGSRPVWMASLLVVSLSLSMLYAACAVRCPLLALPFEPEHALRHRGSRRNCARNP